MHAFYFVFLRRKHVRLSSCRIAVTGLLSIIDRGWQVRSDLRRVGAPVDAFTVSC